jgi:hypothetical protein
MVVCLVSRHTHDDTTKRRPRNGTVGPEIAIFTTILGISKDHLFKIRNFGRSIVAFTMPIHLSPHHPMRYLDPTSESRLAHRTRVDPPCDLH